MTVRRGGARRRREAGAERCRMAAARASLVLRDNFRFRRRIESSYRLAIAQARARSSSPTPTSCPA